MGQARRVKADLLARAGCIKADLCPEKVFFNANMFTSNFINYVKMRWDKCIGLTERVGVHDVIQK